MWTEPEYELSNFVIIDRVLANPDRDYHRRRRFCLAEISQGAMISLARASNSFLRPLIKKFLRPVSLSCHTGESRYSQLAWVQLSVRWSRLLYTHFR